MGSDYSMAHPRNVAQLGPTLLWASPVNHSPRVCRRVPLLLVSLKITTFGRGDANDRCGEHRVADYGHGAGSIHDFAGACLVLWRAGARGESALGADALLRHRLPRFRGLAGRRL